MNILEESGTYVTTLFKERSDDKLRYHNIVHTQNVVKAANLIAGKCSATDEEIEILLVSAWFHDVGYLETKVNHEDASKYFAREFLQKKGKNENYIRQVERCIEATRIPQKPLDKLSAILCDADLFHVSQDDFMEDTRIFWDELAAIDGEEMNEIKYLDKTLRFLNLHVFKTEYGKTILDPGKKANLKKVKKALEKRQQAVLNLTGQNGGRSKKTKENDQNFHPPAGSTTLSK